MFRMRQVTRIAGALALAAFLGYSAQAQVPPVVYDVPTGSPASPLFGAGPFTQHVRLMEEFGTRPMPTTACSTCTPLPPAPACDVSPLAASIDTFLRQPLITLPTRLANTTAVNPWLDRISACVRPVAFSPAEGRPSGEWYSHQRWDEFQPREYFVSGTTGARINNGTRDAWQRHGYAVGEFKLGGLYHFGGTNRNTEVRFHPRMPVQSANSVWTFDGTMPPKLLMVRNGVPTLFRHYNMLPVSAAANNGFGRHTLTTHHHNGHNPAESDGYPAAYFFPGQFYDYRWPLALAGHDTINTTATDPRAGFPNGAGGITRIRGDWRETMSSQWFHDHMKDYTAPNVYKGMAAVMNVYSAVDRGREGFQCHYANEAYPNLCLPSGTSLDWGNRDYDVNLVVADKAWNASGQLHYNIFNTDGFLGDRVLVNWGYKPFLNVRARKYRLRILNGSIARYFKFAIVNAAGQRVPYHMISNDGNIMEHAVPFPNAQSQDLPPQAIAERFDIVIDFKSQPVGAKLYLVNLMEHTDGKGPKRILSLAEALSPTYAGDPAIGRVMEFRVNAYTGQDLSMNPADYEEGKKKMIPVPTFTPEELSTARKREFEFGRSGGTDSVPWTIKTDGGQGLGADLKRITAAPVTGAVEIWRLINGGNGWAHPVHIHFEEGRILSRDGLPPPIWEKFARKDVYRIGDAETGDSKIVDVAIRIREFAGTYVEHCHNTTHEDHAMLMRWDSTRPGSTLLIPTPRQTWEGTFYEDSYRLLSGQ
jgi:FtsP/CotA-like multicopper oxidase with cupredoxin domain